VFEAADGPLIVATGNNAQFERFCRQVIARPDIADDPRFATNMNRSQHRAQLHALLTDVIGALPRDALLERMTAAGIPCGKVAGLYEALTSERSQRGGLVCDVPHPVVGATPVLAPPYRLDRQRLPVRRAPPTLGEGTREVLQSLLSMTEDQLRELQTKGVLTLP